MGLVQLVENVGSWRLEVRSGEVFWCPRVYKIHGLAPAEGAVNLEKALSVYHPEDARTVAWLVERSMVQSTGFVFIARLKRTDGKIRLVESAASVEVDADGKPKMLFGIFRDVTERYNSRDIARSRGMLVRSIIRNSPSPIVVTDRAMRYLDISPAWLSYHGLSPDEKLIGKSHYEVFPQIPGSWRAEHRKALNGAVIRRSVSLNKLRRVDTAVGAAGSVIFPWYAPDGRVGGLIIMVHVESAGEPADTPANIASLYGGGGVAKAASNG